MEWGGLKPDDGNRSEQKREQRDPDKVYCEIEEDGELCNAGFMVYAQLEAHIKEEHDDNPKLPDTHYSLTCINCDRPVYMDPENPGRLENVTVKDMYVELECACGNIVKS